MVVVKMYTPEWNYVGSCEGMSEKDAIAKVSDDFKGHAIVYQHGEIITKYEFK